MAARLYRGLVTAAKTDMKYAGRVSDTEGELAQWR